MPPLEGQELLEVLRIRSVVEGEAPAAISAPLPGTASFDQHGGHGRWWKPAAPG